jgi:hypothetical protein
VLVEWAASNKGMVRYAARIRCAYELDLRMDRQTEAVRQGTIHTCMRGLEWEGNAVFFPFSLSRFQ